jgi:hypothetical protein
MPPRPLLDDYWTTAGTGLGLKVVLGWNTRLETTELTIFQG